AVQVMFTGAPAVIPEALLELVKTRPGQIVRHATLKADREALLEAYRSRGFLRVVVGDPLMTEDATGGTVVTFPIRAGERIAIDFRGNTVLEDEVLLHLLPENDAPLRERDVRELASRVVATYVRLGRFGTTAKVKGYNDGKLVRYVVIIDEKSPKRVESIEFPGATAFDESVLADQIRATVVRGVLQREGLLEPLSREQRCLGRRQSEGSRVDLAPCPVAETEPQDRWVPALYEQALVDIMSAYQNSGFLSVTVGPAIATFDGDVVRVEVPVREGIQTFVRSIAYHGNEAVGSPDLLQIADDTTTGRETQAPLRPGAAFSSTGIEDARIASIRAYRDRGYVYARVFSDVTLSEDRQWADVDYRFEEGPQVHVGRVVVRGNRYTREGVIRSRITLKPGDIYRLDQALTDQRAIGSLGVFASVRVKLIDEEKPAETKDLIAEVVERDRQPFEISPGLSTADGPRLLVSYSHINVLGTASIATLSAKANRQIFFDLYGQFSRVLKDRYESFTTLQQVERELRAGIHSPRIIAWPLKPSFRLDLVQERTNVISYSFDSTALIAGIDTYPGKRWTLSLEPSISYTALQCPSSSDCTGDVSSLRPDRPRLDNGTRRTFKVGPSFIYDHRDNAFNPRRGFYGSLKSFYAIGDLRTSNRPAPVRFVTTQGLATAYFPMPVWGMVLALSARGGIIANFGEAIPIDERFFLGGRDTLRGYVERTLIPQDVCVITEGQSSPLRCKSAIIRASGQPPITPGGETYALLKTELRIPLAERFSLGLFLDAGNLWFSTPTKDSLAFRYGTGAGIRYATPVGALALDLGVNPDRRSQNAEARLQVHFSVGVF
ncbi:MAG: BamA/TamA family outer membrane protein, partial [Clostridia bacterium]|nr:BamA/TamA family outer membrane protein [Deltaproteobacteria bacterium]